MTGKPKVSVLLATWNRAGMISRTIESVRNQAFKDWELVITDDGSTDDTPSVARDWQKKEPRIVYVRSEVNQGISKNYNQGFRAAKGEYVAMIDDDDPWITPEKLAKQVRFLDEHPDYVGCGGGVIVVDDKGKNMYRYFKPETDREIRKYMLFSNPMANSTTMFRFDVAKKIGLYDESNRYAGDRDFWMKMGLEGKLYNFQEYFSHYTMGDQNTSILRMRPHLKSSLTFMKRYRDKYPYYPLALVFNTVQYWYSFLPLAVKRPIHALLARLKRLVVK
ncbi:glycosyltransferase family 2 protein [Candidatus Parcubacteria bacterium]|nr:MAG: glycosyltransferase family 2 protein [Candidatus Parcubacteria bacterium]